MFGRLVFARILPTTLLVLFLIAPSSLAEKLDEKAVEAIVHQAMKEWKVPGTAIAVVQNNKVVYLKTFGVREHGKKDPVTPDTRFAIASCTKAFTAMGIAMMVSEGKASWDDPVRKHLPYFRLADPLADRDVTLRDLLCHRTGLSQHGLLWFCTDLSREQLIRRLAYLPQARSFRSGFLYNNNLYVTAGTAGGAINGTTWEELIHNRIFKPLGMKGATCDPAIAWKHPNHASRHHKTREGAIEVRSPLKLDIVGPAGSIHSSIRDLTLWVRFQLGDGTWKGERLLRKSVFAEMHTPQVVIRRQGLIQMAYPDTNQVSHGLGWFVHDHRGHFMISHTGGLAGARARIVLVPKQQLGIILLMNSGVGSSYASMHYVITNTLLDLLLDLPKKDWNAYYLKEVARLDEKKEEACRAWKKSRKPGTKPSLKLQAYAGTYLDPAYGKVQVSLQKDALHLHWERLRVPLEHFHFDTFVAHPRDMKFLKLRMTFHLNAGGKVASLQLFSREFKRVREER